VDALHEVVKEHWGYSSLRPLQHEAMLAAVGGRDSLVVLPTGGGKSLCYQAPALLSPKPTVVVSPLIALMKDQVDRLIGRGIPSAFLNSSLDTADRRRISAGIMEGEYKLIFVAPERFGSDYFFQMLGDAGVGAFAIDEAHCISHWGHDFRSDYRQLGQLKRRFPDVPVHAFTATATPRVRDDIVTQLALANPVVLVGDFFRPNLMYRVTRRTRGFDDVIGAVLGRPGKAGIVYCIRRADVDELTLLLKDARVKAIGYHAGMTDDERTRAQDAFAARRADVVVATVAFGMGIDRPDIRFVIHAAMPKTIEHYQQETGRAGRDGLPAECILFYSGGDFRLWQNIIAKNESANQADQIRMLSEMYSLCTGAGCRHRRLVSYFGQAWDRETCGACDVCTGGLAVLADSTITAQKIMSCVVRLGQRFGPAYVADVLRGAASDLILQRRHDKLSTYGLIRDQPKVVLMAWMEQLVDQGLIARNGEYRTLSVTPKGWQVLHSKAEAKLYDMGHAQAGGRRRLRTREHPAAPVRAANNLPASSTDAGGDHLDAHAHVLFEKLRVLRRQIADERNVPAFMVFSDKTLREMARARPASRVEMLGVHGVGPAKWETFGRRFLETIQDHAAPRRREPF
jgi:ATP-dependent DNA helicase RecQ